MAKRRAGARGRSMSKKNIAETTQNISISKTCKPSRKISKAERKRRSRELRSEVQHFPSLSESPITTRGQMHPPFADCTIQTLKAYERPQKFERQQLSNGHAKAQKLIMERLKNYIGTRVVSGACGTGWLDQKLIHMKEKELHNRGELRLLGFDINPANIVCAEARMNAMLERNKTIRIAYDEGRFSFQYMLARLGTPKIIQDLSGNDILIPSFSDIDLNSTVIQATTADTFLIFMAFVLWVHEREIAIQSISEKCHKQNGMQSPTYIINGEEYPTHVTPNQFTTSDFEKAVATNKLDEVSTDELWEILFPRHGIHLIPGGRGIINFSEKNEEHALQYSALKYEGGSNHFGFRKIQ